MARIDPIDSVNRIAQEALTALTIALAHLQLIRKRLEGTLPVDQQQLAIDVRRAERVLFDKAQRIRDLQTQVRNDSGSPT